MFKKLLELRQQKAALETEMRSILTKADEEKRSTTEAEGAKFDELRAQADNVAKEIARYEAITDEQRNQVGQAVETAQTGATNDELRHWIKTGELRSLATNTNGGADGGYSVIPQLDKQVMKRLTDDSVMRQIANVVKLTGGKEWKKLVSVGGAAVNHIGEGEVRTETATPKMNEVTIAVHNIYAYPRTTQEILDFGGVDILGWLTDEISESFTEPNIGKSIPYKDFENTIAKARGMPSEWVEMLTKRFNVWCNGSTPWLGEGNWKACERAYDEADLRGKACYMGLDLSSTNDLTSLCYVFPIEQNHVRLITRHYIPEYQLQNVANKNRAMYRNWERMGWLRITKGDCIDYDRIRDDIFKDAEQYEIKMIGFDVWNATHLRTQLQGYGLDVEPFPQTYQRYSPVAKSAEVLINRQMIEHNGDPVLSWALSNVVMESDANANIKPNKKKSANKIDPAIAFLMALGTYQLEYGDLAFEMTAEQQQALADFNGLDL